MDIVIFLNPFDTVSTDLATTQMEDSETGIDQPSL